MFSQLPEELAFLLNGPSKAEKPKKAAAEEDEVDWALPASAVAKIRGTFEKVSEGEELAVSKAMKIFLKSEVKPKDVAAMCGLCAGVMCSVKLVCGGQPKTLTGPQFVVIMGMLQNVRKGAAVPKTLPAACEELLNEAEAPKKPAKKPAKPAKPSKPAEEEEEPKEGGEADFTIDKATFAALKKRFQKETEGEETMAPALAIKYFKKSGVPEEDVKQITKMVLKGHKGPISLGQFVVIMYVLKKVKEGAEVPSSVPAPLKRFL